MNQLIAVGVIIFAIAWTVVWHIDFNRRFDHERPHWLRWELNRRWHHVMTDPRRTDVIDATSEEVEL